MTNKDFYASCRDHRKTETDPNKQHVLADVYGFMRERGVSKDGARMFVDYQIYCKSNEPAKVEAYRWLLSLWWMMRVLG